MPSRTLQIRDMKRRATYSSCWAANSSKWAAAAQIPFCCGAGGGRIWIPDPVGSEKPAQIASGRRRRSPGLEVYVVSCPKDLTMFEDALKTTGNEGKFVVKELIELIREAIPAARNTEVLE